MAVTGRAQTQGRWTRGTSHLYHGLVRSEGETPLPTGSRSVYGHKRSAARYRPVRADDAFIEFDSSDGSHRKFGLVEVSAAAVGFALDGDPVGLSVGATIDLATISAGALRVAGRLRVVHLTSGFASGTVCGAQFSPATEADERTLSQWIARLDARGLRSG
jgi:hypothetical protein